MNKIVAVIILMVVTLRIEMSAQVAISLEQCRKMALDTSETMMKAGNSYEQARLDKAIAFTSFLPKIDGTAIGISNPKSMEMFNMELQMKGVYMAGISLTQPIYVGGKIITGYEMSKIGIECAELNRQKTRMDIIANADNSYWSLYAIRHKIKMIEASIIQVDTLYSVVKKRVDVQMSTKNDLLRIETRRTQMKYQLEKAKNGALLCQVSLCNIIGVDMDTQILLTDSVKDCVYQHEYVTDVSSRPEFKLLEKQVDIEKLNVKLAKAEYLPTISFSAQYSYFGNLKMKGVYELPDASTQPYKTTYNSGSPMFMVAVSVPLWNWGQSCKKVKKAKLQVENARLSLQENRDLMDIELRQAIQNVEDGIRLVQTAKTGIEMADENLKNMALSYNLGMSTLTDYLEAQAQWQEAQSSYIEAQAQYMIYETQYRKAAGILL